MPVIEKHITVNVPAEVAIRYLSTPSNLTEICENVVEVSDAERHKPGEGKFAWSYKMLDVRIFGEAEFHEIKHNQQLNINFKGGIQGEVVWQFQPLDEGLLLQFKLDYATPPPLLKKHTEDDILRQNDLAAEHMLIVLKSTLAAYHARTINRV
jgi:hypothetical protein